MTSDKAERPPPCPVDHFPCRLAAEHLAKLLITHAPRWLGVCYYDEQDRAWMVLDLQGRRLRCEVSPIREAQAFAIFDEARCRGTDLKLRSDAVGLLTLGPTTCKDKLMQVYCPVVCLHFGVA
jgi:hypothetical protein